MIGFLQLIFFALVVGAGVTTLIVALVSQLTDPSPLPHDRDPEGRWAAHKGFLRV